MDTLRSNSVPTSGGSVLLAAWRTHRPKLDTALLIVPNPPRKGNLELSHCESAFCILVSGYMAEKSMNWFSTLMSANENCSDDVINGSRREREHYARAMLKCPPGHPVLLVRLPLDKVIGAENQNGYTENQVRTFFALATSLHERAMSDDGVHLTAQARALASERLAEQVALHASARDNVLSIHSLASFFQAPRVLRWVDTNLVEVLDDDVALFLLDYATQTYQVDNKDVSADIHESCVSIYSLMLMWYRCLRAPLAGPTLLDAKLLQMARICVRHAALDEFGQRVSVFDVNSLELRGALVKCVSCYDAAVTHSPDKWGTTMVHITQPEHQFLATPTLGRWALQLHEERCASGKRWLSVHHIGDGALREYAAQTRQSPQVATAQGWVNAELFALSLQQPGDTTAGNDFTCHMEVRCIRRDRRLTRAPEPAVYVVDEFRMSAVDSGMARFNVYLPPHWRQEDYCVGYCPMCRKITHVAVLVYRLTVRCDNAPDPLTDDEPMPDAPPLGDPVAA